MALECSGSVTVTNQTELNSYANDLGHKKGKIKNLNIAFSPNLNSELIIATPCSIKISDNINLSSSANICLHGETCVTIGENFKFNGKNLTLESRESNKTLQGVDVNKNGIRDDVDIWIKYVGKNRNHRMALRQLAKKEQLRMLVGGEDVHSLKEQAAKDWWDADNCVAFFERNQKGEKVSSNLTAVILNTQDRIDNFKKFTVM